MNVTLRTLRPIGQTTAALMRYNSTYPRTRRILDGMASTNGSRLSGLSTHSHTYLDVNLSTLTERTPISPNWLTNSRNWRRRKDLPGLTLVFISWSMSAPSRLELRETVHQLISNYPNSVHNDEERGGGVGREGWGEGARIAKWDTT